MAGDFILSQAVFDWKTTLLFRDTCFKNDFVKNKIEKKKTIFLGWEITKKRPLPHPTPTAVHQVGALLDPAQDVSC